MNRPLALTVLLTFSICACGREAPPSSGAGAASPESARTTEQQRDAVMDTRPQASQQDETEQATAAQESSGDVAASERSDASLERLAAMPADKQLPGGRWKAGTHYTPVVPAQPTSVAPGKVEVAEVFWYGCSHCYALEPYLQSWSKNKPEYAELVKIPVMWGPVHRAHARLFYALEELGRSDLHAKVFETIHQRGNMLASNDPQRTRQMHVQFARENGISEKDFNAAYDSFNVDKNLRRAEMLTAGYQVDGVPFIAINGKYATSVGAAGGHSNLLALINDLAAAEHGR
mgnify:CR=1 FL=1